MKAYILSVGNEVLSGKTINTNTAFLASELELLGIEVLKSLVVGDDDKMIKAAVLEFIDSEADLIITTGGLGPTHDDFTKEVISETLNMKLVLNDKAYQDMYNYFKEVKNDCNVKQAYFPEDSIIIPNKIGSADGVILKYLDKTLVLLVGPPYELQPMFKDTVAPYLETYGTRVLSQEFITMGNSESYFENLLGELVKNNKQVQIAPYAENGKVRYRIWANPNHELAFNKCLEEFKTLMNDYIISDHNESIEAVVVKELLNKGLTISFAESCTGGMMVQMITSVAGASLVLNESLVVYSEMAKTKYLDVNPKLISQYGVVSLEVAKAMALGLEKQTSADVCVSVTGYAGPTGEDVGKVCFAIKYQNQLIVEEKKFRGNREMIRIRASRYILYRTHLLLK